MVRKRHRLFCTCEIKSTGEKVLFTAQLKVIAYQSFRELPISNLPTFANPNPKNHKLNSMEVIEHSDEVFTLKNLWSPAACQELIRKSEASGFEKALVNTPDGPVRMEGLRNNDRLILEDEDLAAQIWGEIAPYVPQDMGEYQAIGLNELFRIYRYDVGQEFNWHYDAPYQRNRNERSFFTFSIYLNDDFEGGATAFEEFEVKAHTGDAILFYQELYHAGLPITSGRKYLLRSDLMYSNRDEEAGEWDSEMTW